MIIYEHSDVCKYLSMPICIDLMKKALADLSSGINRQNVRTGMGLAKGGLALMPCYMGSSDRFGAKIISVYPGNAGDGYPSHQGYVLLFEGEHGSPVFMADAAAITDIRTAAVSAAATDLLSKKDAHHLAILGSGAQAKSHLEAMTCVRDITDLHIWSYHREHAERFADWARARYDFPITVCDTVEAAARNADLICTVCRSKDPILASEWVADGTHINAVGTCSPVSREVNSALVKRSRLYCDQKEACCAESGEYLIPLSEGMIHESHLLGSIGDLMNGTVTGRTSDKDVTLFDSLGLAIEDLACADFLYGTTH